MNTWSDTTLMRPFDSSVKATEGVQQAKARCGLHRLPITIPARCLREGVRQGESQRVYGEVTACQVLLYVPGKRGHVHVPVWSGVSHPLKRSPPGQYHAGGGASLIQEDERPAQVVGHLFGKRDRIASDGQINVCGGSAQEDVTEEPAHQVGGYSAAVEEVMQGLEYGPGLPRKGDSCDIRRSWRGQLASDCIPASWGLQLPELFRALQVVYVEDAVDVVGLVLQGLGQETIRLETHRLAVPVQSSHPHLDGAYQLAPKAWDAEAALLHYPLSLTTDYLRVYQHAHLFLLRDLNDNHSLEYTHLVGGQANAVGIPHGIYHVVDELMKGIVYLADPSRLLSQDRVGYRAKVQKGQGPPPGLVNDGLRRHATQTGAPKMPFSAPAL